MDGWQIFGEDAREANFSHVTTNLLKELETRETGAVQTSRLRCHLRIGRLESLLHRLRVHFIKILNSLVLILKSKGVPGGKSSILLLMCLHQMTTGWDLAVRQLIIIPALLFLAEQSTPPGRLRPWVNCFVTDLFQHYCSSHKEKKSLVKSLDSNGWSKCKCLSSSSFQGI